MVNEPLSGHGSLRPSIWGKVIGPQYIELALRWAHEADPEAKLFVNDYSTERLNAKSDAMLALARTLIDAGVPLQGVGFQTHISTTWHPTREELRATSSASLPWASTQMSLSSP